MVLVKHGKIPDFIYTNEPIKLVKIHLQNFCILKNSVAVILTVF
jgi:hypothetical protein